MSEDKQETQGFGVYHPEAAHHGPYNEAMAAWRNEVRAMQDAGVLPPTVSDEPLPEDEPKPAQQDAETPEISQETPTPEDASPTPVGATQDHPEGTADNGNGKTDQSEGQEPESGDEPQEVYDPAEHTAPEVLEHLKGVGEDEAVRILESEKAGKNRKGITSLEEDVLKQARENDETDSGSKDA